MSCFLSDSFVIDDLNINGNVCDVASSKKMSRKEF